MISTNEDYRPTIEEQVEWQLLNNYVETHNFIQVMGEIAPDDHDKRHLFLKHQVKAQAQWNKLAPFSRAWFTKKFPRHEQLGKLYESKHLDEIESLLNEHPTNN